jgi:hypothetical protein
MERKSKTLKKMVKRSARHTAQVLRLKPRSWSLITLHRAGSAYLHEMLMRIFAANDYEPIDLCGEAFRKGVDTIEYVKEHLPDLQRRRDVFFGPFRADTAALVGGVRGLRPIVHVRDVRDCIVSMFFSQGYSHRLAGEGKVRIEQIQLRERVQALSIDSYVEEVLAGNAEFARMVELRSVCEQRRNAVLSRYEEMVGDFPRWIDNLARAARLKIPKGLREDLLREAEFKVSEDKHSHRRQVWPGDFRRKLAPETQAHLTERYRADLGYFGYDA